MRNNWVVGIVVLVCLALLNACQGDAYNAGESILSEEDRIKVKSDTFGVTSKQLLLNCPTPDDIIKISMLVMIKYLLYTLVIQR